LLRKRNPMSNCINIRRSKVFFGAMDMDVQGFVKEVQRIHALPRDPYNEKDQATWRESCIWWFLGRNVTPGAGGVVVEFGEGKSDHTWRDFCSVCKIIGSYMKRVKKHTFDLADEGDGFTTRGAFQVTFGKDVEPFRY
jgi:hypothetical protein